MGKRILFLFNTVSIDVKKEKSTLGECASPLTVAAIYEALEKTGNEVIPLNVFNPQQVEECILKYQPVDLAFVIAEGFLDMPETLYNGSGAMAIRGLLSKFGIPSTHSDPEVMKICRNKDMTYRVLAEAGIRVPSFTVIDFEGGCSFWEQVEGLESRMSYPLFVKPAGGGSSICIDKHSVVWNRQELLQRVELVQAVLGNYPILVETYLPGREYTVGVMGNGERYVLPIVGFPVENGIRTAYNKLTRLHVDGVEILSEKDPKCGELVNMAYRCFEVLGASDLIRIDIKEDAGGICHIIDVNGTPSLSANASVVAMAEAVGIEYSELIGLLLYEAMKRANLDPNPQLVELITEPLLKFRSYYRGQVA